MKKLLKVSIFVCFLCLFTACGSSESSLKNFSEEQLKTATIEVIDMFKDGNYDGVVAHFADEIQAKGTLKGEDLKKVWEENFKESGNFVEYGDFSYDEKNENGFIVAITKYENNKVQFTLSFDKDMKLTNFFMK